MIYEYSISAQREDFYNITSQVREAVAQSGVTDGIVIVYCPHTTAGITINENADSGRMGEQQTRLLRLRPAQMWCATCFSAWTRHSLTALSFVTRRATARRT